MNISFNRSTCKINKKSNEILAFHCFFLMFVIIIRKSLPSFPAYARSFAVRNNSAKW